MSLNVEVTAKSNQRKIRQRFLAFFLIGIMLFSLSACTYKTGKDTNGQVSNGSSNTAVTTAKPNTSNASETTIIEIADDEPIVYTEQIFGELLEAELQKENITQKDLDKYTQIMIGGDHFISLAGPEIPEKDLALFFGTDVELDGVRYKGFGTMKSLEDLKYFRNLEQLTVTLQPELDYTTIPSEILSRLKLISISQSKLKDISFLRGATSLISLRLSFGEVEDLSPLSECTNLMYLSGSENPIKDLSPIKNLTKLKSISLPDGQISDLTPLAGLINLESVGFNNNQIVDLSPLINLTLLEEVALIDNQVKDVSPLKDLPNLEKVRLKGNPVENIEVLENIADVQFEP